MLSINPPKSANNCPISFLPGKAPFWKEHLSIVRKQIEDASPTRGDSLVIERFQVLQSKRLPLLIRHGLFRDGHKVCPHLNFLLETRHYIAD